MSCRNYNNWNYFLSRCLRMYRPTPSAISNYTYYEAKNSMRAIQPHLV